MYFWNSYPFVRFSIALILGIVLFDHFPIFSDIAISAGLAASILLALSVLVSHRLGFYKLRHLNGLLALIVLVFVGAYNTKHRYHSAPENHYKFIEGKVLGYSGKVSSTVNERTKHFRYSLDLTMVKGDSVKETFGTIHLYVQKDSLKFPPLKYGDMIMVRGSFFPVGGPDNPEEFDYRNYLSKQGIYAHSFVNTDQIQVTGNTPKSQIIAWAYSLRRASKKIIDRHIPEPRENAISKALLLGIKDYLDNDIKQAYASAGAMHVLAVSGLHVGIIYLLLRIVFGKMRKSGNAWRYVFGCLSVLAIWLYATVTGLSPSVMRAATMFTVIAIGDAIDRDDSIYNSLGIAAFILLIYDPYLVYSVGFQLSFAAVTGIVYLQPKLYRLFNSRYWIIDKAWSITCVSIAAQLATFPLSAYYFHQFPTYFLVSNLVVIPGAFLLLIIGVVMLLVDPLVASIGQFLGKLLYYLMWGLNESIEQVQKLPFSLVEWIYMDRVGLILTYLIVISLISGLQFHSFKTLIFSTILSLGFIGHNIRTHREQVLEEKLIFYEIKDRTAIDYIRGESAHLFIDEIPSNLELLEFQIDPNRLANHLPPISQSIFPIGEIIEKGSMSYGQIAEKRILIFDSTTFHLRFTDRIKTDILLIENESV